MKALVSKIEPREGGYRVAQVVAPGEEFAVAEGMMWVDCDATVAADAVWYDPNAAAFRSFPIVEAAPTVAQPVSTGTQTL
jgi:hypothetical protein